jgi:hypothetical protein
VASQYFLTSARLDAQATLSNAERRTGIDRDRDCHVTMTLAIAITAVFLMIIITILLTAGLLSELSKPAGNDNQPALRFNAI